MPDGGDAIAIRVIDRVGEVPAGEWDACAGPDNPFLRHGFLSALEDSGSVGAEAGWLPQHLTIKDSSGRLVAAAPLYLKSHSYGEYVFDWGWAEAYERAGGRYYPKLQCAVPFTPVTGPRLLIRPDGATPELSAALLAGMVQLAERHGASSLHITFPEQAQWRHMIEAGMLARIGLQYFWTNRGYESFEDFLGRLTSRKRKAIKKERRKVAESGIVLKALTGEEIEGRHWEAFYRFYLSTADRKWGHPYLNREFFHLLGERMGQAVVLMVAEWDGKLVAGALNLRGATALYGRNWGATARAKFLHFEACYYQAIDYAIAHGLERVEAGAQGEHKIQRGYLPEETYSAHWIADPGLRDAVEHFLERERRAITQEIDLLAEESPYKQESGES
ncbi:MAG: GNAT family N-acetyltransferase [Pseudomonadota bacterium]